MHLLDIEDLTIQFKTKRGIVTAVDSISFYLNEGETLGVVGESGCGKSITSLAIMGLLPPNAIVKAKKLDFMGMDLLKLSEKEKCYLRGSKLSMIFQDPMTALNPCFTVGQQLIETLKAHDNDNYRQHFKHSVELLDMVGIPAPETRMNAYPHELSGGMGQRVMIAQAIACNPKLLIADEPTTALDVTIQAQILSLLKELQDKYSMAVLLITHDIGVVAQSAARIQVMYAGHIVEKGQTKDIINSPRHPYTQGLMNSLPGHCPDSLHGKGLTCIAGLVPDLYHLPRGCLFHPRCQYVEEKCKSAVPPDQLFDQNHYVKCIKPLEATNGPG